VVHTTQVRPKICIYAENVAAYTQAERYWP